MQLKEYKLPNASGWWARRRDNKVKWFRIDMCHDDDDQNKILKPMIYINDFGKFIEIKEFTLPGDYWFGSVIIPKEEY